MSFREKINQRIREEAGESLDQVTDLDQDSDNVEPFIKSDYFGVDNARNAPACLDLRLSDGNSKAIPYSYILEINYNLSDGIEITSSTKKIIITGRNLKVLYNYLISYRVKHVQANIGNDLQQDRSLFVKDIIIEET